MVKFTPFTIDATHLNYNTIFNERTGNSLNSTYINTQQTLNRIKHLTQQDFQTPSNFNNEEIVETIPSKIQQSISPFHPTLTTTHKKNTPFPQTTIQSTITIIRHSHQKTISLNWYKNVSSKKLS